MANINDFKLVQSISEKYFNYLNTKNPVNDDLEKERLGFYLFVLECVTGNKDISELSKCIIDNHFQKIVFDRNTDDNGMDAVYTDEENHCVKFFNFKYRKEFNPNKKQSINNVSDSTKFILAILQNNISKSRQDPTTEMIADIYKKINSKQQWDLELYIVSNENIQVDLNLPLITSLKDNYALETYSITLDTIKSFFNDKPSDLNACFSVDKTAVMTYEEDPLSSKKSYLFRLPLRDIARITSNDSNLRKEDSFDNSLLVKKFSLEMGVLYDNIRGFLGNKGYNNNIVNTIKDDPAHFFVFNNGLTLTTKNINTQDINAGKRLLCNIEGFQVVNGGQTLRSIYNFITTVTDSKQLKNLDTAEALVRVYQTNNEEKLTNDIAEFTNSQNAISPMDLKSISNIQIGIEHFLETKNILYVRKAGDIGVPKKKYDYRISMELVAQIIYADMGFPERVSNQKKKLFSKYYNDIFNSRLDYSILYCLILKYKDINTFLEENSLPNFVQKKLYMVYISSKNPKISIKDNEKLLQYSLKSFRPEEDITEPRKMIQTSFKELVDKEL
jgi:hypothetical protein